MFQCTFIHKQLVYVIGHARHVAGRPARHTYTPAVPRIALDIAPGSHGRRRPDTQPLLYTIHSVFSLSLTAHYVSSFSYKYFLLLKTSFPSFRYTFMRTSFHHDEYLHFFFYFYTCAYIFFLSLVRKRYEIINFIPPSDFNQCLKVHLWNRRYFNNQFEGANFNYILLSYMIQFLKNMWTFVSQIEIIPPQKSLRD